MTTESSYNWQGSRVRHARGFRPRRKKKIYATNGPMLAAPRSTNISALFFLSFSRLHPRFRCGPGLRGMEFVMGTVSRQYIASNQGIFGPRVPLLASPEPLAPQRHSPLPPIMDRLGTPRSQDPSAWATCQLPLGTRWRCIEEPLSLARNFLCQYHFIAQVCRSFHRPRLNRVVVRVRNNAESLPRASRGSIYAKALRYSCSIDRFGQSGRTSGTPAP